jgi:hypothetical protein
VSLTFMPARWYWDTGYLIFGLYFINDGTGTITSEQPLRLLHASGGVRTKSLLQGPQQVRRRRFGSDQPSPHNGHDALQGRLRPEGWIGNGHSRPVSKKGASVARRCCFRVRLDEMVLNTKEAWASKLRARLIAAGKVAVSGLLQALRLLEVLWIMSAMRSLSCVPRFLFLSALAIRTRSVEV